LVVFAVVVTAIACSGFAHDLFAAYIQHRVAVTLGAKHVDVTVQLTFFEDGSEHERAHLDADGNGRISRAEIEAYLREFESRLAQAVGLRAGGQAVALLPLYPPAIDLLGNDRVGRGHHRLTLHFFAPTPVELAPGMEMVVEDRLWPGTRALGLIQAEGRDGCRLEAIPPGDPVWPPARDGEAREFKARLLAPPGVKPASPASAFSP
jgi:hypothetical protein